MGTLVHGRRVRQAPLRGATVLLDEPVCALVLENALSNATQHGHDCDPDVRLSAELKPVQGQEPLHELVFCVTNRADPNKPTITDEFVRRCICGEREQAMAPAGVSEGLGLQHIFMAGPAMGMTVSLAQEGDFVTFQGSLHVRVVENATAPGGAVSGSPPETGPVPAGLTFCCIDDSAAARLIVANTIARRFPESTVREYGQTHEEVPEFMEAVLSGAAPSTTP